MKIKNKKVNEDLSKTLPPGCKFIDVTYKEKDPNEGGKTDPFNETFHKFLMEARVEYAKPEGVSRSSSRNRTILLESFNSKTPTTTQ